MKPYLHARGSAKKYGGKPEDYLDLHMFLDETKAHVADNRHRIMLHNSYGIFLGGRVFGETRTNSAGKVYSTRDVLEDHVIEDLGMIPSLSEIINAVSVEHLAWLAPERKKREKILSFDDLEVMEQNWKNETEHSEKMLNKHKWTVAKRVLRVK